MLQSIKVLKTTAELQSWRADQNRLALVPTMGALHAGHLALIDRAKADECSVLVTIYVNPTQFNRPEDLSAYPQDHEGDLALLRTSAADAVWFPRNEDLYPNGILSQEFDLDGLDLRLEGALRPGHFQGVATVVDRLFDCCHADRAYFGLKDFQQVAVVKKLAALRGGIPEIVACPTQRDADGLALSSRNRLLTPAMRASAPFIYRALRWAAQEVAEFPVPARGLKRELRSEIERWPGLKVESIEFVFADTLESLSELERPVDRYGRDVQVLVSVYAGEVRLIDNSPLYLYRA